jgi:hypothetical protein
MTKENSPCYNQLQNMPAGIKRKGIPLVKKKLLFSAIPACLLALGLMFAGCGNPSGGGGDNGGPGAGLTSVTVENGGQVKKFDNYDGPGNFTKSATLTTTPGGKTITVSGGKIKDDVVIGTPEDNALSLLTDTMLQYFFNDWDTDLGSTGVKYAVLRIVDSKGGEFVRENFSQSSASMTEERITYVYVDAPVTVTLTGKTESESFNGMTYTETYEDATLEFQTGWNAVYNKEVYSGTQSTQKATYTVSLTNKNLSWYYYGEGFDETEGGGGGGDVPPALVAAWYTSQDLADADDPIWMYKFSETRIYVSAYTTPSFAYTVSGNTITMTSASLPNGPSVGTAKFTIDGTKLTLYDGATSLPNAPTPLINGEYYKKAD